MDALNRIVVKGFKSIREMNLELHNLNVLIGANGSGKSNLLSVFRLLNQIAEGELETFVARSGGANALLHFGQKTTNEMILRLHFEGCGYEACLIPTTGTDALVFRDEKLSKDQTPGEEVKSWRSLEGREAGLSATSHLHDSVYQYGGDIAKDILNRMKTWQIYHFHDTSDTAPVKLTHTIHDNARLRSDAANLVSMLYLFQNTYPDYYGKIVKTIRLVAPFFSDFALRPVPENPNTIRLEWRQRGSDDFFYASHLSDGTLRFLCLTTLLMQPEPPPLIIIDEPELGLHPYAITLVASMLKSVSTKSQVIIATQSAPMVNEFELEDIVVVEQQEGASIFKRHTNEELAIWLDEYSLGEIWEKNVIGGQPHS